MPSQKGSIKRTKTGCISCRLSKKKCDEVKPKCSLCVKKNVKCIWSSFSQSLNQYIGQNGLGNIDNNLINRDKRTRTGCIQCRKSKKKCDESKPACKRCFSKNIRCEWKQQSRNSTVFQENSMIIKNDLEDLTNSPRIPFAIDTTSMFLFNIFFNMTIKTLVPERAIKIISEITLETFQASKEFRKVVESLSAAFLYNADSFKREIMESMHSDAMSAVIGIGFDVSSLECKLHSVILSIVRTVYIGTDNNKLAKLLKNALDLILQYKPSDIDQKVLLLIESFIYNFSVSVIFTPYDLIEDIDPFIVGDLLRSYFPDIPTEETNPLLDTSLDIFLLVGKVSYIFRKNSEKYEIHYILLDALERQLKFQPMNVMFCSSNLDGFISIPINTKEYLTACACKMLIYDMLQIYDESDIDKIIDDVIFVLKNKENVERELSVCGLWGLFIFGLKLKQELHRKFILNLIENIWKETRNSHYIGNINYLKFAWNQNLGYSVLRDPKYLKSCSLN
jgi:hypothetical protein